MDFYLDTGIFFGADPKDDYHVEVKKFFFKFPISKNVFYSAMKVKNEIEKAKQKLIKNRNFKNPEVRKRFMIIEREYEKIKEFLCYEEKGHPHYKLLFDEYFPITNDDKYDAGILANGIIWSCDGGLVNPTIITVDNRHFFEQKEEIIKIGKKCTGVLHIPLDIQCVWDIV